MSNANPKAFTLIELVLAVFLIGMGLLGIVTMLQQGLRSMDKTRQDVVAINLAREGMEAMFSLRNTNWLRWSGKRSACWLLSDTFATTGTDCEQQSRMTSGTYIVQTGSQSGQTYFRMEQVSAPLLDLSDGIQPGEEQFALCESDQGWSPCPGALQGSSEGLFFRQLVGYGLYRKDVQVNAGESIVCSHGATNDTNGILCGGQRPLEYRFCVRVASQKHGAALVEQCSLVTNFVQN